MAINITAILNHQHSYRYSGVIVTPSVYTADNINDADNSGEN
jgi:hypothetical protein